MIVVAERRTGRVMNTLTTEDSTVNLHHWGVPSCAYADNPKLDAFFEPLSTNVDSNGSVFVSMVEGKDLPVYMYAAQYMYQDAFLKIDYPFRLAKKGGACASPP